MKIVLKLAFICLLLNGCSTLTQDVIRQGYYYDVDNAYKIKVPNYLHRAHFNHTYMAEGFHSAVTMDTDFGLMCRIEDVILPEDIDCNNITCEHLEGLFYECVFMPICNKYPSTQILEQKYTEIEGIGVAYFGTLYIPEGGNLLEVQTGKRCDAKMTYMISFCENHLVVLSQQSPSNHLFGYASNRDNYPKYYQELIDLRRSYQIIK
jgi:hypothetical protein